MTAWKRREVIGDCTLYLGDCLEVMPELGKVNAVVTDPPYGLGDHRWVTNAKQLARSGAKQFTAIYGDDSEPDLSHLFALECSKIIFGANHFPNQLPHPGRWICWDKRGGMAAADRMIGSPFELAWEDRKSGYEGMVRILHGGVVNADGYGIKRVHPTQKPIELMAWCIKRMPDTETILDPFMGSGTTLVACAKLGRKGIGIEIDEGYFDIACKRVEEAYRQPDFFVPAPAVPPEQLDMLGVV